MPQIARTDDKKPTAGVRSMGARESNATAALTEKARDQVRDVQEASVDMAEKTANHVTAAVEQTARHMPKLATGGAGPMNDLAGFWQDLIKAQIEHNLDAFRKLTAARDWHERLNIQNGYIAGNLARMSQAASHCMQLTGAMAARQPTSRNGANDRAR